MTIYSMIIASMAAAACGGGFSMPDPIVKPEGDDSSNEGIPAVVPGAGRLVADGNDEGTYSLILGSGYNYETPDLSGEHKTSPYRHIRQVYDDFLERYVFEFILHIENDDDRGKENIKDRQRNEIKTDAKSPDGMVAMHGETLKLRWKFMLPEGMKTTEAFSHVHQLKGIDNSEGNADVDMPVITFTARSLGEGKQQLQVIYVGPADEDTGNVYLAKTDLEDFLGEWVEAVETVRFSEDGTYDLTLTRLRDGKELVKISCKSLIYGGPELQG